MERTNDNGELYYTHFIPVDVVTDIGKLRSVLATIYPTPAGKLKGFEIIQECPGGQWVLISWDKNPQNVLEEVKKTDDNGLKKD
ncbi:hypothetical protein ACHAPU_002774 [Fusarium lateritium]